jgi:hypothetical protein
MSSQIYADPGEPTQFMVMLTSVENPISRSNQMLILEFNANEPLQRLLNCASLSRCSDPL